MLAPAGKARTDAGKVDWRAQNALRGLIAFLVVEAAVGIANGRECLALIGKARSQDFACAGTGFTPDNLLLENLLQTDRPWQPWRNRCRRRKHPPFGRPG